MKKLIFFAKHMEIGGLEKALLNLLNGIDYDRFQVTLVLEEARGAFLKELDGRVRVEEYRLSACRFVPLRKAIHFSKRMLWALKNHNRYDFSCSYCTYSVIGSRLAQYASKNSCLYVHNDYTNIYPDAGAFRGFFELLKTELFRSIIFVSNESREGFVSLLPQLKEKTFVINNIIDYEYIKEMAGESCESAARPGETVFIFIGRLSEHQKRLSRLLESMRIALKERTDIHLLLIGDGPDKTMCEKLVREYGLESYVTMLGAQKNPYKYLVQADCLVLSSDYEGFPVVYYEALILGKDIITTVPVSDEQIDISDYAVITDKTPEAIAKAMVAYQRREPAAFEANEMNNRRMAMLYSLAEGEPDRNI